MNMNAVARTLSNMFQSLNNYLQSGSRFSIVLVLLGLLVATIYVSPHVYRSHFLSQNDQIYFPLNPETYIDEVNATGPRIREIIDGKFIVSDVDSYEYKDTAFFRPPLPPLLLAPISLLTQDVLQTIIISDFIFPFAFLFLFYWLGMQLFGNKLYSSFFAVTLTLFPNIGKFFPTLSPESLKILIVNLLPVQLVFWSDKLGAIMRESYIPDLIIFAPALIFLITAIKKRQLKYYLLTALFFGLTFYTYPFHWIFLTISIGILAFQYLISKEYDTVVKLTVTVAASYMIGAYYFVNYFLLQSTAHGQEIFDREWIEKTHLFRVSDWEHYIMLLVLVLVIFWLTRKKDRDTGKWLISLLAAGFVVLNMQVITGMNIAPIHWIPRTNTLAIDFAVFYILFRMLVQIKNTMPQIFNYGVLILTVGTISLITGSIHQQYVYAKKHAPSFTMERGKIASLTWLDAAMETDEVVMTGDVDSSLMIPVHTKGRLFVPRALNTYTSTDELIERFFIVSNVLGWTSHDIELLFDCKESELVDSDTYTCNGKIVYYLYGATFMGTDLDSYKDKSVNYKQRMPKKVYREFISRYEMFSKETLKAKLNQYKIDYLYLDHNQVHVSVNLESVSNHFDLIYSHEDVKIYRYKYFDDVE